MKGVFFCEGIDFTEKNNYGIENKVYQQIKCLKSFSRVSVVISSFKKNPIERIKFLLPFIESDREKQRKDILKYITRETNYIYIRKPALCVSFYKLLLKIKKTHPNIFIIMEIPTYPFHSEYTGLSKTMTMKSAMCEKKLRRVVDTIATYSDDDVIWGIKTVKLSNCVDYSSITPRSEKYHTISKTIRLTCVANFTYWHGADRLINGIKKYNGDYKIIFNLVGGGREIENLKRLASGMQNIVFYGPKTGEELSQIFEETDIAIDALGRHRSGVYYNSSLKGKEYVARGIPVISAVKTELDKLDDFPYYYRFPANDESIDIDTVIKFYSKIYNSCNPLKITNMIRSSTKKFFDYKYGFTKKMIQVIPDRTENETS